MSTAGGVPVLNCISKGIMTANLERSQNVIVLGATGNVGFPVVKALATDPAQFKVTAVTRDKSKACFPPGVQVEESDLSQDSLRTIFKGQDAIVSCLSTSAIDQQKRIVNLAAECSVARFIPSEYGLDYSGPDAVKFFPVAKTKVEILEHIRTFEERMTWTTLVVGAFFDPMFGTPGLFGWSLPQRRLTVFDGGDVLFETTTFAQIGAVIATILSPAHLKETMNQTVYVNSFTTTQNEIAAAVGRITGKELTKTHDTTAALRERALIARDQEPAGWGPISDLITASVYGQGDLNAYSQTAGKLWNDRLRMKQEDLVESIQKALNM
ncbi:hypothetical protein LTR86_010812 [Recurvomyces mirabilis]|nr:hypothetical protein LTR86_010812 [Recurvomyces mirabilis]